MMEKTIEKLTEGLIDATKSANHVRLMIVTLGNVIAKHKRLKMYQRRYARRGKASK